ncbi:MAG: urease accessory protein UreD [Alphaproteobacteria bacterium]
MQRASGVARVGFSCAKGTIRVSDLYQSSPCRVLMPRVDGRDHAETVFINTAGGVAGGDQLDYALSASDGATVLATTQASEKIYSAIDRDARVSMSLSVGAGSTLEWLPQQTIAFDGARLRRKTHIDVEGDGRLLALDWLVMGRLARGEVMKSGSVKDEWTVRRNGRLAWVDALRFTGDLEGLTDMAAVLSGNRALATLVYVGDDAGDHIDLARNLAQSCGCVAGATSVRGILVARFLASDGLTLLNSVGAFLDPFRQELSGLSLWPPRLWTC